jgi:hypothetical protein
LCRGCWLCTQGDQASIIGGAINYVKELEQLLQSLEARKHARRHDHPSPGDAAAGPFAGFFTFPQYSMNAGAGACSPAATAGDTPPEHDEQGPNNSGLDSNGGNDDDACSGSRPSSVAEVEMTMVESHANLKLMSRRRPKQLLRLVAGLQGHRLTVLHLNATSDDARRLALYSLSLKVRTGTLLRRLAAAPLSPSPGLGLRARSLSGTTPPNSPVVSMLSMKSTRGSGTGRGCTYYRRPWSL